ncbi:hypothetical protein CJU90_3838 [Yarrowia sp. C11]|nr:hypothetical protein CKK34_5449 [Yarrowia sp. E02]KAG5367540.1 hypothetical protein CJU90_3838 [Yarrowia sp. C11]
MPSPMLEAEKHKYKQFRPPVLQLNDDTPERPGSAGSSSNIEAPLPSPRAALLSGLKTATDRRQQQMQQQQQLQHNYTVGPQGQRIWSPFQEYPGIQRVGSPSTTGVPYGGYSGGSGSGYNSPIRVGSPRSPMFEGASLAAQDPGLDGRTSPSPQSMYAHLQAKQRELQVTSLLISQQQERIQMALNEAIQEGQQQPVGAVGAVGAPPAGAPGSGQGGHKFTPTTLPAHHSQHQWLHEQLLASPLDDSYSHQHAGPPHGSLGGRFNAPSGLGYGLGPGRPSSPSRIQRPSSANFLAHPTPITAQTNPYMQHSYSHSHSSSASMVGLAPGSPVGSAGGLHGGFGDAGAHSGAHSHTHSRGTGPGGSPESPAAGLSSGAAPETPFRRGHRKASSLSTNVFTSPNKDGRQPPARDGDLMFPVRQPSGPPPVDELQSRDVNFDQSKVTEILRT